MNQLSVNYKSEHILTLVSRQERQYHSVSWLELFNSRNIIRVHCAIFTHVWSQMSGTNAMMYYIVYIFQVCV